MAISAKALARIKELGGKMHMLEICKHLNVSETVVRRYLREFGIQTLLNNRVAPHRKGPKRKDSKRVVLKKSRTHKR